MKSKIILAILSATVIFTGSFVAPHYAQSVEYGPDTLVKTSDSPIIYYIASDGKKYPFPSEAVYRSWYPDSDNIQIISNKDLISIPSGKARITIRPGAKLAKFANSPKVYVVKPGALLYWIKNERAAEWYYGANWKKEIIIVDLKHFNDYTFQTYLYDYSLDINGNYSKTKTVNSVYNIDDELRNRKIIVGGVSSSSTSSSNTLSSSGNISEMPVLRSLTENLKANLQPAFNYATNKYTLTAQYTENVLNLKPIAANRNATIYVNGTPIEDIHDDIIQLDLRIGLNQFEIKVKLNDQTFTYYLEITREQSSNNAYLSSVSENLKGNISPSFNSYTYEYEIYAAYEENLFRLTATAADKKSTVQITPPGKAPSYSQTAEMILDYGTNVMTVEVKAENGNSRIYKFTVIRRSAPSVPITNNNTSTGSGSTSGSSGNTTTGNTCPRSALTGTPRDPCPTSR